MIDMRQLSNELKLERFPTITSSGVRRIVVNHILDSMMRFVFPDKELA